MNNKHYKTIKEVSKLLNIKEHVIRHWDSVDPKTNKLRITGLSTRSKSGIRYFNNENIKKLEQIKNILFDNGKHIYSLDLANKIAKSKSSKEINETKESVRQTTFSNKYNKLEIILDKLKNLRNI